MFQTVLIVGLGWTFVLIKFPTETTGDLFFLKMRAFHMSSAVRPVSELFATRPTLKLFHWGKQRSVKHLFHQVSKYIYKHSGRENSRVKLTKLSWRHGLTDWVLATGLGHVRKLVRSGCEELGTVWSGGRSLHDAGSCFCRWTFSDRSHSGTSPAEG